MPQMAPIGWLSLFIIFSIAFMLFNMMNFYSVLPSTPKPIDLNSIKTTPLNWKW